MTDPARMTERRFMCASLSNGLAAGRDAPPTDSNIHRGQMSRQRVNPLPGSDEELFFDAAAFLSFPLEKSVDDQQNSDSLLTRRDFVARTGRAGIALAILPPDLRRLIRTPSDSNPESLAGGVLSVPVSPELFSGLRWRMIGPFRGGRVAAASGVPGRPNEFYFGAVNGGVWKTIDGGRIWFPIFDGQSTSSIGAIAVASSDPNIVFVGSGESTLRDSVGYGNGVYKSTDGGTNWSRLSNGLPKEGIGRTGIAVSPTNPNRVYAIVDCLLPEAPPQREPPLGAPVPTPAPAGARPSSLPPGQGGFFRSDDAGATWTRLSNDPALWGRGWYFEKIAVDPTDPDTVYVPNVAVNRTMDGGKTWVVLRGSPGGDDYHQPWFYPNDPNTMIVAR